MGVRADTLKQGDVIWTLDYNQDTESGEVKFVKDENVAVIETGYNKNLVVWDARNCYSSEEQALVSAAQTLQHNASQLMRRSQAVFERLTKLREAVVPPQEN